MWLVLGKMWFSSFLQSKGTKTRVNVMLFKSAVHGLHQRPAWLSCCHNLDENSTWTALMGFHTTSKRRSWEEIASHTKPPDRPHKALPTPSSPKLPHTHFLFSTEGPLIRVICVSHHLVSLRTHWSLADSSLQASLLFLFLMLSFIWPFPNWGHFLEARDRMLFLTALIVWCPPVWWKYVDRIYWNHSDSQW